MDAAEERDVAAELDELRPRQDWAEERIRTLAEALNHLAQETAPSSLSQATRQVLRTRLQRVLGRDTPDASSP
jgi:hypothetical protein